MICYFNTHQSIGCLVDIVLQAIVVISVVLHAVDYTPDIPEGILVALAEEAHTPASVVVVTVPATIAKD